MAGVHQPPVSGVFSAGVASVTPSLSEDAVKHTGDANVIQLKRVYNPANKSDGARYLVERLWPRGVKKDSLKLEAWVKEVAPSSELRKWFSHDPAKWSEFRRRYFQELRSHPEAWETLLAAARRGRVTLVYSSHDTEHNNAVALKEFLEQRLGKKAA